MTRARFIVVVGLWCLWAAVGQAQLAGNPFTARVEPDVIEMAPGETTTLRVILQVPARHYLYREATEVIFETLEGLRVGEPVYPPSEPHEDPFLGKVAEIYTQDVVIDIPVTAPAEAPAGERVLEATVTFQGCSEKLCYRKESAPLSWRLAVGTEKIPSNPPFSQGGDLQQGSQFPPPFNKGGSGGIFSNVSDWLDAPAKALFAHGTVVTYALTFLGGALTSFTPCILPLIPVILLIIGIHPGERRRNLRLAANLALGLALTYAAIGLFGVLIGQPIGFLFQQRWFLLLVIAFFVAMALSMFGLFSLQLPSAWQTRLQRVGGAGPRGAFLAGISTGLLATPCAGPVVAALVAHVGVQRDYTQGFLLLFTYGAGLGTVFMVVGTFYGRLAQHLPKGVAARVVKILLGCLLLLPAAYYTWVLVEGTSGWVTSETDAFAQARALHRPVLIEFTSKTCVPCVVMERTTFREARVRAALAERIVPLRVDTTFASAETDRLIDRYRVVGWPTLLFASPSGEVFWDLSFVGDVVSADRLLEAITAAEARIH